MAVRDIVLHGDPLLERVCKPVKQVGDYVLRLLGDMWETLDKAQGIGLAAIQVGVLRRIAVIEYEDIKYELINPQIMEQSGEIIDVEGCLSVPGRAGKVARPAWIRVQSLDREGNAVEYEAEGYLARAFCHEMDHLDGIVYLSKMLEEVDLNADEEDVD